MTLEELNALVHEKVMGQIAWHTKEWGYEHRDGTCERRIGRIAPPYFTDMTFAWQVIQKLEPYHFTLKRLNDGWWCELCVGRDNSREFSAYGGKSLDPSDAARAICLTALKAKGLDVEPAHLRSQAEP